MNPISFQIIISILIILTISGWIVVNLFPKLPPVINVLFMGVTLFLVGLYNAV